MIDQRKEMLDMHEANHSVAVLLAPRLGDSLLIMTIAHNLSRSGRRVVVYGDYANALSDWFPDLEIHTSLNRANALSALEGFDLALQMHVDWPFELRLCHPNVIYYDQLVKVTGKGFVKLHQIRDFCRDVFKLEDADIDNGLRPLNAGVWRQHPERVVIHPTSTGVQRCWDAGHFRKLGLLLKKRGYDPQYIVSPVERSDWAWIRQEGLGLPELPSLSAVAEFIHRSGWFIGNESGVGHLASNLGVPTLSLTGRPTRTRCWLPSWTASDFVYPRLLLGGRVRDRYWRTLLAPASVMRAFEAFRRRHEGVLSLPEYMLSGRDRLQR